MVCGISNIEFREDDDEIVEVSDERGSVFVVVDKEERPDEFRASGIDADDDDSNMIESGLSPLLDVRVFSSWSRLLPYI